jgi:hypothetical protein
MQTLRRFALQFPETEEGVACEGTALESRTVKRKNKAFLFLRATEIRLKLAASAKEASARAAQDPARYKVGAHGWVLVTLDGASDPVDLLERWIEESYSLLGDGKPTPAKSKAAVRKVKKKSRQSK